MHLMQKVVSRIIRAMGTPLAQEAHAKWVKEDFSSLVHMTVHPGDYVNPYHYQRDAQVIATFRKLEGLPTGVDLEAAAEKSFFDSERVCKETNNRLARYVNWFERGFEGDNLDEKLFEHLGKIRKLIGDVLGPIPRDLCPRFSSGSTFNDRGVEITIPHKMSSRATVTANAWSVIRDLYKGTAWDRCSDITPELVRGNRFTSVSKDSTKNRGICVEPSISVAYQLSVGAYLCERLRLIGINIKGSGSEITSQDLHKVLAHYASIFGDLGTIDLSNASDTVAYMLVKLLLPRGWFDLLSALRSPETFMKGQWVKLHKFSSMGNGFTFELETLIFWALCKSVSDGRVLTYGDDIIIAADRCPDAVSLLKLCGFTTNTSKSFYSQSPLFRESCGGDYFEGVDVRPVYLKKIPECSMDWIVLANQVDILRKKMMLDEKGKRHLDKAHELCVNAVVQKHRLFGPKWAGDMVIHSENRDLWITRPGKDENGLDRGYSELLVNKPQHVKIKLKRFHPDVQLASALLGVPSSGPIPRDAISGYKTTWRATVM